MSIYVDSNNCTFGYAPFENSNGYVVYVRYSNGKIFESTYNDIQKAYASYYNQTSNEKGELEFAYIMNLDTMDYIAYYGVIEDYG